MDRSTTVARLVVIVAVAAVAAVAGWVSFVAVPDTLAGLLGVLLVVGTVILGVRLGRTVADSRFALYNVAEVPVEGPIRRQTGGGIGSPIGTAADDVVEQIDRADEQGNVDALLVKLNTPGGEIVPSEDIRLAAERFDGPTVAYATDVCASGGYDVASGCDELWARDGSIVGSIGVIGSRVTASELADRLGLSYEQLTAGEYKDAGIPLKELEDDERRYLQGLVDDYYADFVETVAEGRDLDPDAIRETEARVYLGPEALELGLVDELGTREDVEDRLEELLDESAEIREFAPRMGLRQRLSSGAQSVAYALGAGVASVFDGDVDNVRFRQ